MYNASKYCLLMLLKRSCGLGPANGAGPSIVGVSIIGVVGPLNSKRASGALTIGLIEGLLPLAYEHWKTIHVHTFLPSLKP